MTDTWPDGGDLQLEVTRLPRGEVDVISIRGAIDMASVDTFKRALSELTGRPSPRVIVQCRQAGFINSGGLGAIYACHRACQNAGGAMVLCEASGKFRDLISTIGLDRIVVQADSEEAALALLDASSRSSPAI